MDVSIGEMTSTVRTDEGGDNLPAIVGVVLEAVRMEAEHRERVHAERWIPCCAACADDTEEAA